MADSAFTANNGRGPWFDESVVDIAFTGNDVIGNTGPRRQRSRSSSGGRGPPRSIGKALRSRPAPEADVGRFALTPSSVTRTGNISIRAGRAPAPPIRTRRATTPRTRYAPLAPWTVRNTVVSNNVIAESAGNCLVCVQDYSLRFTGAQMVSSIDGNLYHRTAPGTPRWFSAWSRGAASKDPAVAGHARGHSPPRPGRTVDRSSSRARASSTVGTRCSPPGRPQGSRCRPISPRYRDSPRQQATLGACSGDDVGMGSLLAVGARALTMVIALVCGVLTTRMIIGEARGVDSFALYTLLTTIPLAADVHRPRQRGGPGQRRRDERRRAHR